MYMYIQYTYDWMKKKISPQNFEIAGPSIWATGIRMGAVVHIVNITTF